MPSSQKQIKESLEMANAVRIGRSVELRRIFAAEPGSSHRLAATAIRDPSDALRSMPVINFLLRAVRGLGRVTAVRMLRRHDIPERATLGELDQAERDRLVTAVLENAKRFA